MPPAGPPGPAQPQLSGLPAGKLGHPPARHRSSRMSLARIYPRPREDEAIVSLASCILNAERNCTATP